MNHSWLYFTNKYFLQIFFIRLARIYSSFDLDRSTQKGFKFVFRVPVTGWKK